MRTGRPKPPLMLNEQEHATLAGWARRPQSSQRLALRSRIVLRCAAGQTNRAVAPARGVSAPTVGQWRSRFLAHRRDGLADAPRSGAPRKISDAQGAAAVTRTLATQPAAATHGSTRTLARDVGLTPNAIGRIGRAFGLQPHRTETFQLSTEPFLAEKVREVVGLCLHPPDRALGVCVAEKSPLQARERTPPVRPMRPGHAAGHTHDDVRHGATALLAALDVATGQVMGACHRRRRHPELLSFLRLLEERLPPEEEVHLILDHDGTHRTAAVRRGFAAHPRCHLHVTPTSASWLPLGERFFAEISHRRLRRGVFRRVPDLEAAIQDCLACHNPAPQPFVWTASADLILGKVQRLCECSCQTGH